MLRLVSNKIVKKNWQEYKKHLITACEATEGGDHFTDAGSEEYLKGIYSRIINPFNQTMHLWIEEDNDYLLLTHIQTCEFTKRKTLVLFSLTRTKDVDNATVLQRWFDGYPIISGFARENECKGIIGYSDLRAFTKIAEEVSKSTKQKIITRYQYYCPL